MKNKKASLLLFLIIAASIMGFPIISYTKPFQEKKMSSPEADVSSPILRQRFFSSTDEQERLTLIDEIAAIHSPHATRLLAEIALRERRANIRSHALSALSGRQSPSAQIADFINLNSNDSAIRKLAISNTTLLEATCLPFFADLIARPDLTVSSTARKALSLYDAPPLHLLTDSLSNSNVPSSTKYLISDLLKEKEAVPRAITDYYYFLLAQNDWYLLSLAEPSVIPILITGLHADLPIVRSGSARTLGSFRAESAINDLIELLADKNPDVRKAATDALIMMERTPQHKLVQALFDPAKQSIRSTIVTILHATDYRPRKSAEIFLIESIRNPSYLVKNKSEFDTFLSSLTPTSNPSISVYSSLIHALHLSNYYALVESPAGAPQQPSTTLPALRPESAPSGPSQQNLVQTLTEGGYYDALNAAEKLSPGIVRIQDIYTRWFYNAAKGRYQTLQNNSARVVPYMLEYADYGTVLQAARAADILFHMKLYDVEKSTPNDHGKRSAKILTELTSATLDQQYDGLQHLHELGRIPTPVHYQAVLNLLCEERKKPHHVPIGRMAAQTLGQTVKPDQIPALQKRTGSLNKTEQYNAALALSLVSSPENADNLVALLFSKYPELVFNAIGSLRFTPTEDMILPLINLAAMAPRPLRVQAQNTLNAHAGMATDAACALFSSRGMPRPYQRIAADLLAADGSEASLECLFAGLRRSSPQLIISVASHLTNTQNSKVVSLLFDLLQHPDKNVHVSALATLQTALPEACYPLINALSNRSAEKRSIAHRLLCDISGLDLGYEKREWNNWRLNNLTPQEDQ